MKSGIMQDLVNVNFAQPTFMFDGFFRYLATAGKKDAAQLQAAAKAKQLAIVEYYHSQAVAALLTKDFFSGDVASQDTNLSSFIRPEGEHTIIFGIRVFEANNATVNASNWQEGTITAETKNGTLNVNVNGTDKLKKISLGSFVEADETNDAGWFWLERPIIWWGQETIKVTTAFPVVPVASQNLRIALRGVGLI